MLPRAWGPGSPPGRRQSCPQWAEAVGPPRVILLAIKVFWEALFPPAILTTGKVQSGALIGIILKLWIGLKRNDIITVSFPIHDHERSLHLLSFLEFLSMKCY